MVVLTTRTATAPTTDSTTISLKEAILAFTKPDSYNGYQASYIIVSR